MGAFFEDVVVCSTQVKRATRGQLQSEVEKGGGTFTTTLTVNCTHLVALKPEGKKFAFAKEHKIACVSPDWITECAKKKEILSPLAFPVENNEENGMAPAAVPPSVNPDAAENISTRGPAEMPPIFARKVMWIARFVIDSEQCDELYRSEAQKLGAQVMDRYDPSCDYAMIMHSDDPDYEKAIADKVTAVTPFWFHDCIMTASLIAPTRKLLYTPMPPSRPANMPKTIVVSLSRYTEDTRLDLQDMLLALGCEWSATLTQKNTHLVCHGVEGKKHIKALEWGLKVVNHLWVFEMFKRWMYVDECDFSDVNDRKIAESIEHTSVQARVAQRVLSVKHGGGPKHDTSDNGYTEQHADAGLQEDGDQWSFSAPPSVPSELDLAELRSPRDDSVAVATSIHLVQSDKHRLASPSEKTKNTAAKTKKKKDAQSAKRKKKKLLKRTKEREEKEQEREEEKEKGSPLHQRGMSAFPRSQRESSSENEDESFKGVRGDVDVFGRSKNTYGRSEGRARQGKLEKVFNFDDVEDASPAKADSQRKRSRPDNNESSPPAKRARMEREPTWIAETDGAPVKSPPRSHNLPKVRKKQAPHKFAISGKSQDLEELKKLIKNLGGRVVDFGARTKKKVTHVLALEVKATEYNVLMGCALGLWFVGSDYIRDSAAKGRFLDEKEYEVCEDEEQGERKVWLGAMRRARLNKEDKKPGVFCDYSVAIVGVQDAEKKLLHTLIKAGGGKVTKASPTIAVVGPKVTKQELACLEKVPYHVAPTFITDMYLRKAPPNPEDDLYKL